MKWLFIYRRDLVVSKLCLFLHFYISYKYDFHVDAERKIVKRRTICVDGFKKSMTRCLLNSTSVLDFLHQAFMTLGI